MYCPHCGKEVTEGGAFCSHCGKSLMQPQEEKGSPYGQDACDSIEDVEGEQVDNQQDSVKPTKKKKWYLILGIILVAIVAVAVIRMKPWVPDPRNVKETGTYQLGLNEAIRLDSINTTVSFSNVSVHEPDYDTMTTVIDFYFTIDIPEPERFQPYFTWLNEFEVNGANVEYEVGTLAAGVFLPAGTGKTYRARSVVYKVSYTAQPTETEFHTLCHVNDNLEFEFIYDCPFWELDGVDKDTAIAYQQGLLDGREIEAVRTNSLSSHAYVKGEVYRVSGIASYFGDGIFGDDYYVVLDTGNDWVAAYGWFDENSWKDFTDYYSVGDKVAFFGLYDSLLLGSHSFSDCYIYSPTGKTFWIYDDGSYGVLSGKESQGYESTQVQNHLSPDTAHILDGVWNSGDYLQQIIVETIADSTNIYFSLLYGDSSGAGEWWVGWSLSVSSSSIVKDGETYFLQGQASGFDSAPFNVEITIEEIETRADIFEYVMYVETDSEEFPGGTFHWTEAAYG